MTTKPPAHAKLSASGSARWSTCPGSVRMEAGLLDVPSEAAAEGTLAHGIAERALHNAKPALQYLGEVHKIEGFEFPVDLEMVDACQLYIDYVYSLDPGKGGHRGYETKVDFSHVVPGGFGTVDAFAIDYKTSVVTVVDFKYGQGVRVDAESNSQMLLYAAGLLQSLDPIDEIATIKMVIVQPRKDHHSEWTINRPYLDKELAKLSKAALATEAPDALLIPDEKACQFCKAKPICPALAELAIKTAAAEFSAVPFIDDLELKPIETLTLDQIGLLYSQSKLIEDWLKALKAHAIEQLMAGETIPGHKAVYGRADRRWTDPAAAAKWLKGRKFKKADIYTEKIISPAAAERLPGLKKDDVAKYTTKPQGNPTIARESDPRPAIASSAADDFDSPLPAETETE